MLIPGVSIEYAETNITGLNNPYPMLVGSSLASIIIVYAGSDVLRPGHDTRIEL